MTNGYLLLEDGQCFEGSLHGSDVPSVGELVFNTSMTGYQEVLTDPSYSRQTVVMTFPEIGIYGVQENGSESIANHASGMVFRRLANRSWHKDSLSNFDQFLKGRGVSAISGIDTRALTHLIRTKGPQKSIIAPDSLSKEKAKEQMLQEPAMAGRNLVPEVSTSEIVTHGQGRWKVGLLDFGVKTSIVKNLVSRNCTVLQVPWNTPLETLVAEGVHGLLYSNGPGDPSAVPEVRETLVQGAKTLPTMAICLGYQLLALGLGAKTYKLPFGHRGGNHPVKCLETGQVRITAQNHGFAVDSESLHGRDIQLTYSSLFDNSLEGFRLKNHPCFGVQFHPEAGPGPSDATFLFDQFVKAMEEFHA